MNEKFGDGTPLRSFDEYAAIARKYEKWWRPYNDTVMHGICDILELRFRQNIIDVYVAPWFWPISDPMILGPAFKNKDYFLTNLIHEMLHRLITDNTTYDYYFDFLAQWKKMFGKNLAFNTLVHIPVHAALEAVYRDVLKRPELIELDFEDQNDEDYINSWKYVQKVGYKKIIAQLKEAKKEIK